MARKRAGEAGVADRVSFEVASAASFSGSGYDLAATFDCLHDMGDPLAAAKHVRQALKPDGTWLVVEPYAADETAGNMNPVGRVYYSFSTLLSSSPAREAAQSRAWLSRSRPPGGGHSSAEPPRPRSTWSTRCARRHGAGAPCVGRPEGRAPGDGRPRGIAPGFR